MTDQAPVYDELGIRIQRGDGYYHTVAFAPDGSTASSTFNLPFSETELDNFVLRVGRQRLRMRSYRSVQMDDAKRFGAELFEALMSNGVRDVFRGARSIAESQGKGLRVTLYLTDVPELMAVPWEFLYEQPRFLAQSIYSPIVRSLDLGEAHPAQPTALPLNVLGMISKPQGVETLDVDREREKLASALAPLSQRGLVNLEWLEYGTLRRLDEAVGRRGDVHVFHYIGHGAYDTKTDDGVLVLENDRGEPNEVSGEELGLLLQDERNLRLAVLNSCEGARSSHVDPFSGVASSLVHYGIPGVIGMQFEITDEAAIAFSSRLYTSLIEGYPVDAAVAQARRSIFAAGHDIEFGTPVLFLRGADARLFALAEPAPQQEEWQSRETPDDPDAWSPPPEEGWPPAAEPLPGPEFNFAERIAWHVGASLRRKATSNRRLSNLRLALLSGGLVVIAAVVAVVAGDTSSQTGEPENVLSTLIGIVGFVGLTVASFREAFDRLLRWLDRFFG